MKKISFILLFLSQIFYSQSSCENGFAGNYPCNDYDLLSHISNSDIAGSGTEGNDSWGWTDTQTGKEYAIIGVNDGTAFVLNLFVKN